MLYLHVSPESKHEQRLLLKMHSRWGSCVVHGYTHPSLPCKLNMYTTDTTEQVLLYRAPSFHLWNLSHPCRLQCSPMAPSNSKLNQRLLTCCFILAGCVWIFACVDAGMLVVRVWHGASKQLAGAAADKQINYKIAIKAHLAGKQPADVSRRGYQHQKQQQSAAGTIGSKQTLRQQQQLHAAGAT